MFNLNLTAVFQGANRPAWTFLFECGCEITRIPGSMVVYHHLPQEDLTLPLCPLWQCNHEFDCELDSMSHYGACTPVV